MKEWYVFRQDERHFGFGTRQTAERFLRYLNRNLGPNHYEMDRLDEVFPTPSIADVESSPDRVDMEAEMVDWRG